MSDETRQRLFYDYPHAFDHPLTATIVVVVGLWLLSGRWIISQLYRRGLVSDETERELVTRWKSWCWLAPVMIVPVLLGTAWTILAILILSLLCYREYARTTGLFREKFVSFCVVVGILLSAFAALDRWERLYFALGPITVAVIAAATLQADRPRGYIQRVALGVFGYLLFGFCLNYLSLLTAAGELAGKVDYRPVLLLILLAVSANDVFEYSCGKAFGKSKLLPNTTPSRTVAGAISALVLTTLLVAVLGHFVFRGTAMDDFWRLTALGFVISGLGQLGDLILASIKADVGVKELGPVIPGHGGLLDRFTSLLLVGPVVYHYFALYLGPLIIGEPCRIFTSG
jgi:phosphatidate cytidylyltransferase